MYCSLSGSSIYGIFQARVLEWIAISFSSGIFLTQESNPGLPHCKQMLYRLSHQGSPEIRILVYNNRAIFFLFIKVLRDDLKMERHERMDLGMDSWEPSDPFFVSE